MTIKSFVPGQTAYILDGIRREGDSSATLAKIVKVGRKYVTTDGLWEAKFKETSDTRPFLIEHTNYGAPRLLFPSSEAANEYLEREELKRWVREATGWNRIDRYTLHQPRAVRDILELNAGMED